MPDRLATLERDAILRALAIEVRRSHPSPGRSPKETPLAERLRRLTHVLPEEAGGCHVFLGQLIKGGYGRVTIEGRKILAHRAAFELVNGPIRDGFDLDHLCRLSCCIRLSHLEAVPTAVNVRRGLVCMNGVTHCPQGHAYDDTNTYLQKKGSRVCRTCLRLKAREKRAAQRAA